MPKACKNIVYGKTVREILNESFIIQLVMLAFRIVGIMVQEVITVFLLLCENIFLPPGHVGQVIHYLMPYLYFFRTD